MPPAGTGLDAQMTTLAVAGLYVNAPAMQTQPPEVCVDIAVAGCEMQRTRR